MKTLSCDGHFPDVSSSPPGPYQQDAYVIRSEDKLKHPPFLPPHLLQVLLNKDTGISVSTCPLLQHAARHAFTLCLDPPQCDPTLLPEPNHVMLNHLYALSIKVRSSPDRSSEITQTSRRSSELCVKRSNTHKSTETLL